MQSSMASGTLYESCMCSAEFANHYFYEYMQNLYGYGHKQCPWYHGHMQFMDSIILCHRARAGYRAKQSQAKDIMPWKLHGH